MTTENNFDALVATLLRGPDPDLPISRRDWTIEALVNHGVIPPSGHDQSNVVKLVRG